MAGVSRNPLYRSDKSHCAAWCLLMWALKTSGGPLFYLLSAKLKFQSLDVSWWSRDPTCWIARAELYFQTVIFDGRVYWNNIARVIFFPDSPSYQGSIPIFPTSEKQKEKRLKIKDAIFFSRDWINPDIWRD